MICIWAIKWPSQRLGGDGQDETDLKRAVTTIIGIARYYAASGEVAFRNIALPLLLAGAYGQSASKRGRVQSLLQVLDRHAIGVNTHATVTLLEKIYEQQGHEEMAVGHGLGFDCLELIRGQQVVHCGL
jgi:hypothetical protein